jgi:carbamoyltransferase
MPEQSPALENASRLLGISWSASGPDPSAGILCDGRVLAFAEEERLVRNKHAKAYFPIRSIDYCLRESGLGLDELDAIVVGWDTRLHEDGTLGRHFDEINEIYRPTPHDLAYQKRRIASLSYSTISRDIERYLYQYYGKCRIPPLHFLNHHLVHAVMAYSHSGFDDCLVFTVDGSGEIATAAWWRGTAGKLEVLHEIRIPHSLGWFYSAFTEYLGFDAYDGEYKVMGLAAYGRPDAEIARKIGELIWYDGQSGFCTEPSLLSMGPRSYSAYFPDTLVEHLGRLPRGSTQEIEEWHINCAYEVQRTLEEIVLAMTRYWVGKTGIRRLALGGGVALNVKMNGRLFASDHLDDIFIHPLCSDTGTAIGAPMTWEYKRNGLVPHRLEHVLMGPGYDDKTIEDLLKQCNVAYTRPASITREVASLVAQNRIVGWFQGRMEAGPRALGNRSILADPRTVESRDRVNAVIKYREFWRPFCPSMTESGAARYLKEYVHAPFMIITFDATDEARQDIPAVVHVDGTCRVQIVTPDANELYHQLLLEFEKISGLPVLLNTSFNIKGEPIVCSPSDALRTFFATGLDALALGPMLLVKDHVD